MNARFESRLTLQGRWRSLLGVVLVFHAFAHAGAGIWASQPAGASAVAVLWWLATAGFMLSAAWLLAILPRQSNWPAAAIVASMASLGLIILAAHPAALPGAILSLLIAIIALASVPVVELRRIHRNVVGAVSIGFAVILVYLSAAILLRPWHTRWGTTDADLAHVLPDDLSRAPRYRTDHAITIRAPANAVRPLLEEFRDRSGAALSAKLEHAAGTDVLNVSVMVPLNDSTTRLVVHTRGTGRLTLRHTLIAPLGAFLIEPVDFLRHRRMLLSIKTDAERLDRSRDHNGSTYMSLVNRG